MPVSLRVCTAEKQSYVARRKALVSGSIRKARLFCSYMTQCGLGSYMMLIYPTYTQLC